MELSLRWGERCKDAFVRRDGYGLFGIVQGGTDPDLRLRSAVGLVGIGFGGYTIVRHASGPHGVPFSYENYGGPGSMLAGLMLRLAAVYVISIWPRRS